MWLEFTGRFKKTLKRHSSSDQEHILAALEIFRVTPNHPDLDFKKRRNSKYHTLRAGQRVRIALMKIDEETYRAVFVGNHDDITSLDKQGR